MRQGLGRTWQSVAWMLVLAFAAGCDACDVVGLQGDDENPSGGPPPECKPLEATCSDTESFRDGRCQSTYCTSDAECCPGTRCDTTFNLCRTRLNDSACETDLDCDLKGQKCALQPNTTRVCAFDRCTSDAQCDPGLTCFRGSCVGGNPCPTGCAPGEVCDVATASCHPAVDKRNCDAACLPGELKVVSDPALMSGDVCCALECECVSLPPLTPGVQGFWASVALGPLDVAVASQDRTYGDLVVTRFSRDGAFSVTEYVDGFPATGTLGGAVDGPRRGILEPGDNVGEYASAANDTSGRVHVAYYDRTHGALKYALNTEGKTWVTLVVDDADDAGRYPSLTIRPTDGAPVISYVTLGTAANGRAVSRVRVAEPSNANPRVSADWTLRTVEEAPVFDACNGACTGAQVCTLGDTAPRCATPASGCSPSCSGAQACVATAGNPSCEALADPPSEDLPRMLGLGTAATSHEGRVVVAYYDAINGNLKAATLRGGVVDTPVVVDGDGLAGRLDGDVGRFVDAAIDLNGKVAFTYWDATHRELVFYDGTELQGGRRHTVDTGSGMPPGFQELGADASLRFGPDGTAYVAYQQQSTLDLMLAERDPAGLWSTRALVTGPNNGALGFFTSMVVAGTRAYVASVKAELDARNVLANKLGLQVVDVPLN